MFRRLCIISSLLVVIFTVMPLTQMTHLLADSLAVSPVVSCCCPPEDCDCPGHSETGCGVVKVVPVSPSGQLLSCVSCGSPPTESVIIMERMYFHLSSCSNECSYEVIRNSLRDELGSASQCVAPLERPPRVGSLKMRNLVV